MSNIREPQSPVHPHEHKLVRSLGLLDVVMIGIAGMVGGSIFVLTGPAIGLAGSSVILAFILNAIITLFTAMSYAELGSAMPEAGGGYLWVREGLRRPNAFISGWMAWLAHLIAESLYAVGFGSFFISLLQMTNILTIANLYKHQGNLRNRKSWYYNHSGADSSNYLHYNCGVVVYVISSY